MSVTALDFASEEIEVGDQLALVQKINRMQQKIQLFSGQINDLASAVTQDKVQAGLSVQSAAQSAGIVAEIAEAVGVLSQRAESSEAAAAQSVQTVGESAESAAQSAQNAANTLNSFQQRSVIAQQEITVAQGVAIGHVAAAVALAVDAAVAGDVIDDEREGVSFGWSSTKLVNSFYFKSEVAQKIEDSAMSAATLMKWGTF
jgi:hypothetical protein